MSDVGRWCALGLAAVGLALSFGGASAAVGRPILAAESVRGEWQVVRVDPLTLSRVGRSELVLGSAFGNSWDWSPTRTRLAVATGSGMVIIDPARLRVVQRIRTGVTPEQVVWLSAHVLASVASSEVTAVDPTSGQILWRRPLPSLDAAVARWKDELLFVLDPTTSSYGTATFFAVNAQGETLTAPLDQIHAGEPQSGSADLQGADPGLAVDPKAGVAYVVGGGDPVARVDLRRLTVSYSPTRQLAIALHGETGPTRVAAWAGDGVLAVSGVDERLSDKNGKTTDTLTPIGLSLIDTATWTTRLVNPSASAVAAVGQTVLAYGAPLNLANGKYVLPPHGNGLSAYTPAGAQAFHALADQPINSIQVANGFAYLSLDGGRTVILRVKDGATIATTKRAPAVTLLSVPPASE